ncbi:hypothetical protein [Planktotalea sp.]|uniref:GTA baseplate fiber-binding domain-containing protein n=1 Tax=Planktotalea sp. TaxID=2029877 RepID=UPI0035C84F00
MAPDTYDLSLRLRGQFGTDGLVPDAWPTGSVFVLLNGMPNQIGLRRSDRGVERHYRIGPATRGYDDPAYEHRVESFQGVGLRPFAPVHLKLVDDGPDLQFTWVRRTRIEGDDSSWGDVPLGEEHEQYVVQVVANGSILRTELVESASYSYSLSQRSEDGVIGGFEIRVAQVSERFGPGLFARLSVNG